VLRHGHASLSQTFSISFDTGATAGTGVTGRDVWFEAVTVSQRDLRPRGSAQISTAMYANAQGAAPAGYPFCEHANYGTGPQPLTAATNHAYFCVKTNGGHVAEFKVESITGNPAHTAPLVLHLSYVTWQ
jgi:hypothetical protein